MLVITCPWCGARAQTEFTCGGEGHIVRPDPDTASDAEWGDYLFMRENPKGVHFERWFHAHGCRKWFHVARSTVTHEVLKVYGITEPRPTLDGDDA
ncbi:MAG: sarcosine oxidase subunit delta [Pseudomonadota bacterium]